MAFSETELVFLALIFILVCSTWCWEEKKQYLNGKEDKKEEKGAWKKDTLNVCESFAFMPFMHNDKMESRQPGALRDDTKNGYEAESVLNNTFI